MKPFQRLLREEDCRRPRHPDHQLFRNLVWDEIVAEIRSFFSTRFYDSDMAACTGPSTPQRHPFSSEELDTRFTYHAPKPGQPELYQALRDKAKELAHLMVDSCPESRELSLALTSLEEAIFWANAAIARRG